MLQWTLDWGNCYSLADAYTAQPHLRFLQMPKDNAALCKFTVKWGPLFGADPSRPRAAIPVAFCWSAQRRFAALTKLAASLRDRGSERDALIEFVSAQLEFEQLCRLESSMCSSWFPDVKDPLAALQNAGHETAREAAAMVLRTTPAVVVSAGFHIDLKRRVPEVVARLKINSLEDALRWMAWRDLGCGQPISYCAECSKAFRPESKHKKKYCSYECAHRVAARKSARKHRKKSRQRAKAKGRLI
jgi:hypothetical protein